LISAVSEERRSLLGGWNEAVTGVQLSEGYCAFDDIRINMLPLINGTPYLALLKKNTNPSMQN